MKKIALCVSHIKLRNKISHQR